MLFYVQHTPATISPPSKSLYKLQYWLLCCDQLRQSQLELHEVQLSHRQLTARLEQLTEEHSLQSITPHPSSLLCEIEQCMEQEEQEQEREQVTKHLHLLLQQ